MRLAGHLGDSGSSCALDMAKVLEAGVTTLMIVGDVSAARLMAERVL